MAELQSTKVYGDFSVSGETQFLDNITISGNVGIGTDTPISNDGATKVLQIGDNTETVELRLAGPNTVDRSSAIVFDNDSFGQGVSIFGNTDVGTFGNDGLVFYDENNDKVLMKVNRENGQVGIGTTTPTAYLDIYHATAPTMYITNSDGPIVGLGDFGGGTDGQLLLYDSGGGNLNVVLNGGGNSYFLGYNVGIGITNPGARLEINYSYVSGPGLIVKQTGADGGTQEDLVIDTNYDRDSGLTIKRQGNRTWSIWNDGPSTTGDIFRITGDGGSGDYKLSILQDGFTTINGVVFSQQSDTASWNFIGTSTEADDTNKYLRIGVLHYDVQEEYSTALFAHSESGNNFIDIGGGTGYGNAATNIRFFTATNQTTTTGTERMRIDKDGNVGVGTTSPDHRVDLADGDIGWNGDAQIEYNSTADSIDFVFN